ncbi:hypothetical protein AFK68_04035 [Hydrocoleum sp. CS-953]|nr:hypothetical protein AFK68_04035 [Hydrocoleum sp. CS-953]
MENLLDWIKDYFRLGIYTLLYPVGETMESFAKKIQKQKYYYYHRWIEQWQYSSGGDYSD